jgi:hypothetical protein
LSFQGVESSYQRCDPGNLEDTLRHLVPFLAAAFRAPVATATKRRKAAKNAKMTR